MARRSEPWFREGRGKWYVWHDGRQVPLAADKAEAFERWHDLMSLSRVTTAGDKNPFSVVAEQFLDWIARNKKPKTLKVYTLHLQAFADVYGGVEVRDLKAVHVDHLLKKHPGWGKSTQRGVMVCILTALNWAVKQGIATTNPLAKRLDIPPIVSRGRTSMTSNDDFEKMLAHANPRLTDFLIACRFSGTRPHMVAAVTAKHFREAPYPSWVMEDHKTMDSGGPLIVVLNPTLVALTKKLTAERPEGPLFVNTKGNPVDGHRLGEGDERPAEEARRGGGHAVEHREHVRLPARLRHRDAGEGRAGGARRRDAGSQVHGDVEQALQPPVLRVRHLHGPPAAPPGDAGRGRRWR